MTTVETARALAPTGRRRAQPAPRPVRAVLRRSANAGLTALLVVAAVTFFLLAVGPRVLPYQTSTMLTGSMSPGINPGDVVMSARIPVRALRVGDVITYQIPVDDHRVETHRIIELITNPDGSTAVRTKGDANAGADPWTATLQGDTAYRQIATLPYLGQAIRALRTPAVNMALMYGAPAALLLAGLVSIWGRKPAPADADDA